MLQVIFDIQTALLVFVGHCYIASLVVTIIILDLLGFKRLFLAFRFESKNQRHQCRLHHQLLIRVTDDGADAHQGAKEAAYVTKPVKEAVGLSVELDEIMIDFHR